MASELEQIIKSLDKIERNVINLADTIRISGSQVSVKSGLSEISERLGLIQAGEFRTGNGKTPGDGFSGMRMGYPSFIYDSENWHLVGVNNDVLQFGVRSSDGVAVAGAGRVTLSNFGISIVVSDGGWGSALTEGDNIVWVDSNTNEIARLDAGYSTSLNSAISSIYANLDRQWGKGSIFITAWGDNASGPDPVLDAGIAIQSQTAAAFDINYNGYDLDLRIQGLTDVNLLYTDASVDMVGIKTNTPATALDVNGVASADSFGTRGAQHQVNLLMNYPSKESADGVAPWWWSSQNCTLTEEDATGESIAPAPHERVLKGVTTAAGGQILCVLTLANEPSLAVGDTIAFGCWVRTASAGTISLFVWDTTNSAVIGNADTTTTTGSWVWLEGTGTIASGATTIEFTIEHSANAATFYAACPVLNRGSAPIDWKERGGTQRSAVNGPVSNVDPAGGGYTIADFTSYTSPLAFRIQILIVYKNSTTAGTYVNLRPYNKSGIAVTAVTAIVTTQYCRSFLLMLCDDQQRIEYDSTAVAGDTESLYIVVGGVYWEWES